MKHACKKCGGEMRMVSIPVHEPDRALFAGIRVILINDSVSARECKNCETHLVEIPDMEGLTAAVVVARAVNQRKLNGMEIKFMRKAMEMPAKEIAKSLDVSEETISRWENDHQPIGGANEKLFRYLACSLLGSKAPAIEWNMELIVGLEISARIRANEEVVLFFERTKFKEEKRPTREVWVEELEAA